MTTIQCKWCGKWCGKKTGHLYTKMCNRCWELDHRIEFNKELAQKILNHYRKGMELNKLIRIGDAIEVIATETDALIPDIVNALIGIAFSEEDALEVKQYHTEMNN